MFSKFNERFKICSKNKLKNRLHKNRISAILRNETTCFLLLFQQQKSSFKNSFQKSELFVVLFERLFELD